MSTTGLKKTEQIPKTNFQLVEMDELYWFIGRKPRAATRENVYLLAIVSRYPRQIIGFDVAYDKSPERIQEMVDKAPSASNYCTDGFLGYVDVVYPGQHVRNARDKSDTYTVEGVNADLRHYIPVLARRSRCFARTLETLHAVINVFVDAYNRFGIAKAIYRQFRKSGELPFALVDYF
jgi:IS1 family transposase